MIYDLTVELRPDMPTYDDEPGPSLELIKTLERDGANVSLLTQGVHSGTHLDAPCHFLPGAGGPESFSLDALIGPCTVVELDGHGHVTAADLEGALGPGEAGRVILKTSNSRFWSDPAFHRDFRALSPDAARWLVERGARLIGIDYLSVDPYEAVEKAAHLTLLGAGVAVVEGLDLRGVPAGSYQLVCLPIRLVGADGAPARVVLLPPR